VFGPAAKGEKDTVKVEEYDAIFVGHVAALMPAEPCSKVANGAAIR
jgi:hypothetical protein